MKKKCTVVDERQRMEMLEVEHKSFWVLFYALVVLILAQLIFLPPDWKMILGEVIALFAGSCVQVAGSLRRGLWDFTTTPTRRTYLIFAGVAAGLSVLGILVHRMVQKIPVNIPFLAILVVACFVITYAVLALMGRTVLRRRKALEEETDDRDRAP